VDILLHTGSSRGLVTHGQLNPDSLYLKFFIPGTTLLDFPVDNIGYLESCSAGLDGAGVSSDVSR
jgi:hypothetical protein